MCVWVCYLRQQGGDDVKRGLVDGLVLQWRGKCHVHQSTDFLQHHVPAARVIQHLAVLVNLFLLTRWRRVFKKKRRNKKSCHLHTWTFIFMHVILYEFIGSSQQQHKGKYIQKMLHSFMVLFEPDILLREKVFFSRTFFFFAKDCFHWKMDIYWSVPRDNGRIDPRWLYKLDISSYSCLPKITMCLY